MTVKFLTADWRYLAMLNFEVDRSVLTPYLPRGTELDDRNGRQYLSLVAFLFLDTHVLGLPALFHQNFEEVNLRFYVRRRVEGGWRSGVVFIREMVPLFLVAETARLTYNEPYRTVPMQHTIVKTGGEMQSVEYVFGGGRDRCSVTAGRSNTGWSTPAGASGRALVTSLRDRWRLSTKSPSPLYSQERPRPRLLRTARPCRCTCPSGLRDSICGQAENDCNGTNGGSAVPGRKIRLERAGK
jgi:uncharacterized protein YqjF (DUF2071 family)